MNFKMLAGFWKKRGRKSAGDMDCSGADDPQTSSLFCHPPQGRRTAKPFESKQAALGDLFRLLASTGRGALGPSCAPHDGAGDTTVTSSPPAVRSLLREREEITAALDLCLLAIPDEVTAGNDNDAEGDNAKNDQATLVDASCESQEADAKVDGAHDVSSVASRDSTSTSSTTTTAYTLEQWRLLLCQLVDLLFEIDRAIYADMARQSRHSCPSTSSLNSLSLSSGRGSVDSTKNDSGNQDLLDSRPHGSLKKGTTCTSSKASGRNGTDVKLHDLQKTEEFMSLAGSLTTWVILQNILRRQLEPALFYSSTEVEPSASCKTIQVKYAVPVIWDDVAEELMKILGTKQKMTVEILISLWILYNIGGQELVQCVLQKPLNDSDDVSVDKQNTEPVAVGAAANKTTDDQLLSSTTTSSAECGTKNACMDDLVEHVENIYKQNVVETWVTYLEKQSSFFANMADNHDSGSGLTDLCHCHMMVTYALCSPHWGEEKRQRFFQLLQTALEELDELTAVHETNKESTPVALGSCRSQGSILEKCCESSGTRSRGERNSDGSDTSPVDPQRYPFMPQSTPEKQTITSDNEFSFLPLVSLCSPPARSSTALAPVTEAIHTTFEEDLLSCMALASWVAVLHLRVEQCLGSDPPRIEEAERCANKEQEVALTACSFSYRQGALESFVKVRIAAGKYSEASRAASAHLTNAKKRWSSGNYCHTYGVIYLNSMSLLARVQKAFCMDPLLVETAQLAIQQAKLCEEALNVPFLTSGTHVLRHTAARRRVYDAKLFHLQEIWRAYHRMNDTSHAAQYFDQYMEHIKLGSRSKREEMVCATLGERGRQLLVEKRYDDAALMFRCAVDMTKKMTLETTATPTMDPNVSDATATTQDVTDMREREMRLICCGAESERDLALAYVMQAEHEVNVRKRRQQLNNAVNSAYAAQAALQRCMLTVNSATSKMLMDVASSLVVAAKALLRLGQPKKAALLLEPLIEDKVNSVSVRPPFWSNTLTPPQHTMTTADRDEYLETVEIKMATYDVHTQCLSKFDGERACREVESAREFLQELKTWLTPPPINQQDGDDDNNSNRGASSFDKKSCLTALNIDSRTVNKILGKVNALQPILTITFGDSLALLCKWEGALQEYSNALAMYAEEGGNSNSSQCNDARSAKEQECVWNDKRMGESLVLAKLAEVYVALNKPKTAMHYYRQVLDYALEVNNALLQYNARIHLARLYTVTRESEGAGEHWAKVSELAKEYEDKEISRETTRNIVAAQRANGMYTDVLNTAKELDALASAAEGVDAAADRRFALEALADAHLQLGQYKKCIDVLDEREKVQYKCGQWKEPLFKMRARALLGDGAVHDAIKVLMNWVSEARQSGDWVEVGHANAVLALAYATTGQFFKARRHHEIALSAFSGVSNMDRECCNAVIESARWLVHYFYLSNEELSLNDDDDEKEEHNGSITLARGTSPSADSTPSNTGRSGDSDHVGDFQVPTLSGDLSVLMQEEEKRLKKHLESVAAMDGENSSDTEPMQDEESESDVSNNGDREMSKNGFISALDMKFTLHNDVATTTTSTTSSNSGSGEKKKNVILKAQSEDSLASEDALSNLPQLSTSSSSSSPPSTTPTLANVTHCKHPAVMEGEIRVASEPNTVDTPESLQGPPPCRVTKVRTLCFHRALKIIETAAQLSLIPPGMRKQLIPRNPADSVDLAFLAYPRCTFVFYFAEFTTQYRVIIRPALRSFFLERSVQVYSLEDFHSKKQPEQVTSGQTKTSASNGSSQHLRTEAVEKRMSTFASSFSSFTRRTRTNSADASVVAPDPGIEWTMINKNMEQSLQNLHADLWAPVQDSLRMAHCCTDEVECLVLVVDPALLHVPFPALCDFGVGANSLGQQFTVVVTPTVANFMQTMYHDDDDLSLLNAPQLDRCVLLPEQTEQKKLLASSSMQASLRKSLNATKGSTSISVEDANVVSEAAGTWLADTSHPWTLFTGCTRKEMISAFASPSCRGLMVLCDPVDHLFRVADGMVRLADMTRGRPCLTDSLDVIVVTCDRSTAPSANEPGVAARLCLDHGCRRVLRLDLSPGMSITEDHQQFLQMYIENLTLTLEQRMRYPYALALRMTQQEALRYQFPAVVWASLTLIGAA